MLDPDAVRCLSQSCLSILTPPAMKRKQALVWMLGACVHPPADGGQHHVTIEYVKDVQRQCGEKLIRNGAPLGVFLIHILGTS